MVRWETAKFAAAREHRWWGDILLYILRAEHQTRSGKKGRKDVGLHLQDSGVVASWYLPVGTRRTITACRPVAVRDVICAALAVRLWGRYGWSVGPVSRLSRKNKCYLLVASNEWDGGRG